MNSLDIFLKAFFDFLQKVIPTIVTGFLWGYNMANKQTQKAQSIIRDLTLKLKYKENKDAIDAENLGKSDADIINDAIKGDKPKS